MPAPLAGRFRVLSSRIRVIALQLPEPRSPQYMGGSGEFAPGHGAEAVFLHVPGQLFDLVFDLFVFLELPFEKADGHPALFLDPPRRQHVGVGEFTLGALEPLDLDESLFGQLGQAEVDLAHTDAHVSGHVQLPEPGFFGQEGEKAVADFMLLIHGMNLIGDGSEIVKGFFWLNRPG